MKTTSHFRVARRFSLFCVFGLAILPLAHAASTVAAKKNTPPTAGGAKITNATIQFSDAWIRRAPPGAKVHAGYVEISNSSGEPIQLIRVTSPAFGAIELHETKSANGVNKMLRLDAVKIEAGKKFAFKPGGAHLMLFRAEIKSAERIQIPFEFTFQDGRVLTTMFVWRD